MFTLPRELQRLILEYAGLINPTSVDTARQYLPLITDFNCRYYLADAAKLDLVDIFELYLTHIITNNIPCPNYIINLCCGYIATRCLKYIADNHHKLSRFIPYIDDDVCDKLANLSTHESTINSNMESIKCSLTVMFHHIIQ